METANVVFRLLAVSQTMLFMLVIVLSKNPARVRFAGGFLMFAIIAYLVAPLIVQQVGLHDSFFIWVFAAAIPSFLLLMVWVLFEEDKRIPVWIFMLISVDMVASVWTHVGYLGWVESVHPHRSLQLVKILIVALAIYLIWRGRENDLVELRLRLRRVFVFLLAGSIMVVVLVELITDFNVPMQIEVFGMAVFFFFSLVVNYVFFKLNPQAQLVGVPVPIREDSDDPLVIELLARMRDERLYADHDLRVATLAEKIGIPEYQLRKKINQSLGYRNFNQFVNRYRVEEAGQRLRADRRTPVLSIALDVGFRSISSFNAAFQSHFGVSPTQYRAGELADS